MFISMVNIFFRFQFLAYFHPNWSKGTAAVRGNQPINRGLHYWEIHVSQRVFGTRYTFQHIMFVF